MAMSSFLTYRGERSKAVTPACNVTMYSMAEKSPYLNILNMWSRHRLWKGKVVCVCVCVCGNASVAVCARDVLGRSTAFCRPLCRWETGIFYGMLISEGDGTCIPTIGLRQEGKHTRATPLSLLGVTRCDLHFGWDTSAPELLVM